MKEFVYSYPMKVYFGEGAARKAIAAELGRFGKTVMLAYGGGSIKKSGVYDEMRSLLTEAGKEIVDFSDASHFESAKFAATTVSYGIFRSENSYPGKVMKSSLT